MYRWQFHCGFLLSEGSCVAGGVGFNQESQRWDLVNNVEVLKFETASDVTTMVNTWNKNINDWLKYCEIGCLSSNIVLTLS
jgi:hypothetical protein